jgi:hypothetical protein
VEEITETGLSPIGEYLARMGRLAADQRDAASAMVADPLTPEHMQQVYRDNVVYAKGERAAYEMVAHALMAAGVIGAEDWRAAFHGYDSVNGLDLHDTGPFGHVSVEKWLVEAVKKAER